VERGFVIVSVKSLCNFIADDQRGCRPTAALLEKVAQDPGFAFSQLSFLPAYFLRRNRQPISSSTVHISKLRQPAISWARGAGQ